MYKKVSKMKKSTRLSKKVFVIGFLVLVAATVAIVAAVTLTPSSNNKNKIQNVNPMLSYFHISDGISIKWAHAVNSKDKLILSINNGEIMFLEADVIISPILNETIMAHPPAISSDITLRQWLDIALKTTKGIKLDVKQTVALNDTMLALESLLSKYPSYEGPILLNADILQGPNNNITLPVDANAFIRSFTKLDKAILSPGWTTGFLGTVSEGYTMAHVEHMHEVVKDLNQFITFPIRASLAKQSEEALVWLLNQNKLKYSLTVWTSSKDQYAVESLRFLRKYPKNVFFDLPDDELEILGNFDK